MSIAQCANWFGIVLVILDRMQGCTVTTCELLWMELFMEMQFSSCVAAADRSRLWLHCCWSASDDVAIDGIVDGRVAVAVVRGNSIHVMLPLMLSWRILCIPIHIRTVSSTHFRTDLCFAPEIHESMLVSC